MELDNDELNMCIVAAKYDISDDDMISCVIRYEKNIEMYRLVLTAEELDSLYYCIPLNFY